jgi:hypothetical protein
MIVTAQQSIVLLGAGDEGWIRLIVPVVIVIAYVLSAIGRNRGQNQQEEDEQEETPQPPVRRDRVPQQAPRLPRQEPPPIAQRPIPQRLPGPQRTMRTQPVPIKPAPSERHPREVFDRVNKPISTAEPKSVEKLEHSLDEKLKRVEKVQPAHVLHAEQVVEAALKPTVIPSAEVQPVEIVEEVDISEIEIDLQNPNKLREAILFREILDKPLALR